MTTDDLEAIVAEIKEFTPRNTRERIARLLLDARQWEPQAELWKRRAQAATAERDATLARVREVEEYMAYWEPCIMENQRLRDRIAQLEAQGAENARLRDAFDDVLRWRRALSDAKLEPKAPAVDWMIGELCAALRGEEGK